MLTMKAKYALKAMLALADTRAGELLQCPDIAEKENIPKKFLDLILLDLRKNGLVRSHRGKQGGYVLGKPADTIYIGQIIRVIDGPLAPIGCASVTAYQPCSDCDAETCTVRRMMRMVRDAASEILDHMTLAEALQEDQSRTRTKNASKSTKSRPKSTERV